MCIFVRDHCYPMYCFSVFFFKESSWSGLDPFKISGKTFSIGWPFLALFSWSLNLQTCQNPKKATNQIYWPWSISQPFKVLSPRNLNRKEGTVVLPWNGKVSPCESMHCLFVVRGSAGSQAFSGCVFLHRSAALPFQPGWIKQSHQPGFRGHCLMWHEHTDTGWAVLCLELWHSSIP